MQCRTKCDHNQEGNCTLEAITIGEEYDCEQYLDTENDRA